MKPRLEEEEDRERLRCFVALLLSPGVLEELQAVQRMLRRELESAVRWTQPDQMHLTLHFLGEVETGDIDALGLALERAATGFGALELSLQGLGVFPAQGRPRVIWVGLGGDVEALGRLHRGVVEAAGQFGDHQESRDFHPHLTLGRPRPDSGMTHDLPGILRSLPGPRPMSWRVRELTLMSSELLPTGARYTMLHMVTLG
jgi:2'-5' RNA ligase